MGIVVARDSNLAPLILELRLNLTYTVSYLLSAKSVLISKVDLFHRVVVEQATDYQLHVTIAIT